MKSPVILACMLAITFSASSMKKKSPGTMGHNCIRVISMDNDIFYFKSDKDVADAVIEVYDYQTGGKVMSGAIESRKTLVDLRFLTPGNYIILITKGDFKRKYVLCRK